LQIFTFLLFFSERTTKQSLGIILTSASQFLVLSKLDHLKNQILFFFIKIIHNCQKVVFNQFDAFLEENCLGKPEKSYNLRQSMLIQLTNEK
jgi:hypothetical protein